MSDGVASVEAEVDVAAAAREYWSNGYAIVRVLTRADAARIEGQVRSFIEATPEDEKVVTDEAASLGPQPKRSRLFSHLHELTNVLGSEQVHAVSAAILGGDDLVLDTARLLALEVGQKYHQGFHRDVPPAHVVDESLVRRVLEANARGCWRHNVVQCTLALLPDECFWCVPKSHSRLYTPEELVHFESGTAQSTVGEGDLQRIGKTSGERLPLAGTNAIASGVMLPNAVPIHLEPGELLLAHNLLIHRGYAGTDGVAQQRRCALQFAMHAAHVPPTWHFRRAPTADYESLGENRANLVSKTMRKILERRAERMCDQMFSQTGGDDEEWRSKNSDIFFTGGLLCEPAAPR